jgi:hypothetical protein
MEKKLGSSYSRVGSRPSRQLNPQHPVVGFSLTHKAGLPIVDRQKRDFLSPTIDIISFTEDIDI